MSETIPCAELARRFHALAQRFPHKAANPRERAAQLLASLPTRRGELQWHRGNCSCSSCVAAAYRVVGDQVEAYFARRQSRRRAA